MSEIWSSERGDANEMAETDKFVAIYRNGNRQGAYVKAWTAGIGGTGDRHGKAGVCVWQDKGAHGSDALVVMRWIDFVKLVGPIDPAADPNDAAAQFPQVSRF